MPQQSQIFATHRRWLPAWHFFAIPVLTINVVTNAVHLVRAPSVISAWGVIVALALLTGITLSRVMPLRAQDRIIRLEERTRLERVLPADLRGRVGELSERQLIALRFAPDDEIPELTRRALSGELRTTGDIKRAIRNWRADHFRV
jgi:hypothetical protein